MAPFVKWDYEILSSRYKMRRRFYRGTLHSYPDRFMIGSGVLVSDFSYSYFGYKQAYWTVKYSKKFGKKSVVVLAGFDVCEEEDPELGKRLPMVRYVLKNADRLLAVSNRVRNKALKIDGSAEVEVLYNGLDANAFKPQGQKEKKVVTVGYVDKTHMRRKGLEVFVRSASLLPDCQFIVAGKWLDDAIDYLKSISPPNVTFTGYLRSDELLQLYQSASVYVQASLHECFGIAMAEAMLCGCAPVVSDRGAIPEVVGDTGIYINPESPEDVARGIQAALDSQRLGMLARERIARLFPLEARRKALLAIVEGLLR